MVLCSLHRLSPQALRFLCIEVSNREFLSLVLILGVDCGLPIALSSYPSLPIFLRRCRLTQALVLGFMSPSPGWVSDY
jgi:hypothetical protein